ncbi:MAG: ABC transporter ATP-binding protein/permease [Clostridium sp.]|nr:ABC transporter ATP-binding protein/permease [Clostridium sp.]
MKKQSNLSRLMGYAGGHKILTYLSWILSVMSALLALVPFWYIWRIVHDILEAAPDFSQAGNVTRYGWSAVLFAVISVVVYIAALLCSHLSAFRVAANIRKELMRHITALPLGVTEKYGSGKLRRIVNSSSAATETYLAHRLPDKAGAVATPIGLLFLLLAFDWRLGLLSLVPVALGFLIMMKMTGKDMAQRMEQYQNALSDMSNEAVEYVRGIPVVKTFGQTIFSFKRFKDSIDNYEKWVISYTKGLRVPMMFYTTAINGVFAFLIAGGILFTRGGVTNELLLNLIFYIVITPVIGTTLTKIMFMSEDAMIVNDAISRIDEVLNEKPLSESQVNHVPKDNGVTLEHVSYSYKLNVSGGDREGGPGRDDGKLALHDVSLRVEPGQTAALVGASGGGKTTLANLVTRFFDPQKGRVLIGNIDIRDIPKETLMNKVSFVFQNSRLLKASILENVRMAKPEASREEIIHALRAAQCSDIIEKLPNGIDTVVGTNGVYLSGGEQQRIAIARAILKNAPILILDEATAFADPDNEVRIQQALSVLSKGKTVIMIAHRLSSITDADCIYVLQDGEIVESGTHSGLVKKNGIFTRMWKNYSEAAEWKILNDNKGLEGTA